MKNKKTFPQGGIKTGVPPKRVLFEVESRNPELIEKFYKQIINSFGYGYPAKI